MPKFIIYTDGGARGNPGPAGAGAVIVDESGQELKRTHKELGVMTNNEAEYEAVILGLKTLKHLKGGPAVKAAEVEVRLDSELVARQLNGQYQIKEENLQPLFMKIWNQRVAHFPHLKFVHIPREKNRTADRLANQAMDDNQRQSLAKTLFQE
ncbi:MAG: ribonuclease HI family protein [Patescibacteria group bacterium]